MSERFAIYYAPVRGSLLDEQAATWLAQPALTARTVSARRYGFHATLKAPMRLSQSREALETALVQFAGARHSIELGALAPRLIDGFLALTVKPQPQVLTDLAAEVVTTFEPFRAPLEAEERARRMRASLTPRQIELFDRYGYPYVLEEFQFHMTLTDRLPANMRNEMIAAAERWFAPALAAPLRLDRLVLFREPEPGADFVRLDDYPLQGAL